MRAITKLFYFVILLIWGLAPMTILIALYWNTKALLTPQALLVLTLLWSAASVLLFGALLYRGEGAVMENLMGLTCTFVVGIPAMAFSALSILDSPSDFLQILKSEGNTVPLSKLKENTAKTLYVVAIDISESFIKDATDQRLQMVYDSFDSLFAPIALDSFVQSLDRDDAIRVYAFTGIDYPVLNITGVRNRMADVPTLRPKIGELLAPGVVDRRSTDVTRFLTNVVCPEIKDGEDFNQIKVIVFSDWVQSSPPGSEIDIEAQKARIQALEKCFKEHDQTSVSVLSFWARAQDGSEVRPEAMERDISRYMGSNLDEDHWQELDLEKYHKASFEEKQILPTILYSNVIEISEVLYLKYLPDPRWRAIPSAIELPESGDSEKLYLTLRPLFEEVSPIRVLLTPKAKDDFVIGMSDRERAARIASENGPIRLQLMQRPSVFRESRIEMLIASPRCSTIYRIPVVVLPALRQEAAWVILLVVGAMHFLPILLALKIFKLKFGSIAPKLPWQSI